MNISIAMCSYNGGQYIEQQLESIYLQTIPATEIIICDDGSTDDTINKIESYSSKLPIKLYKNESRLAIIKNFEKAIHLCSGDIIFFCDQDDYWLPNKIETICKAFTDNPTQKAIFSNAYLIDADGNKLDKTLWEAVNFNAQRKKIWNNNSPLAVLLVENCISGCTLAIKASLKKHILPIPDQYPIYCIHDYWVALVAACNNEIMFIDELLIYYRQHQAQSIGANDKRKIINESYKEPIINKIAFLKYIYLLLSEQMSNPKNNRILDSYITFLEDRANNSKNYLYRFHLAVKNFLNGNYHKMYASMHGNYNTFTTIIKDVFY